MKQDLESKKSMVLSLIVFVVLATFLSIYHHYYQYGVNTGTIAFFTIAQKYIRGDFGNAIVGGFTPLSSWLLIPFLKLGLAPVLAMRILNLIIGVFIVVGVRELSYRFEMTENIRKIIIFVSVPIVLHFILTEHIPDLLIVGTLVWYLNVVFNTDYPDNAYKGILCGTIGAFGYLGKAFMFPFFISHFLLFNILHYLRTKEKGRKVLRNAILGYVAFFIISGPWIIVLSNKYNKITFDTSGIYNHRIIGPEVPRITKFSGWEGWRNYVRMGHPVYDQGFSPPPNDTAISIWEDFASLTASLKPWSPFESLDYFKYQMISIIKNIYYTIGIFESYFSLFSIVIIIGYILLYFLPLNLILRDNRLYPLFTIILYCGGYILAYPTERYLWINNILILLMGGHFLNSLFQGSFFNNTRKNLLIIFFVLSFIVVPIKTIRMGSDDKDLWMLGQRLKEYNSSLTSKKIASNDKFSETLLLLFYSGMDIKYYGQAKRDISAIDLQRELQKYGIDYYLVWLEPEMSKIPDFLSYYREMINREISVGNGSLIGFKIYSLKEKI